jgi:1-acyl-sn-glycerol-3-phosphate acyltransferase
MTARPDYRGDVPSYYGLFRGIVRPAVRVLWRPRVSGLENLPSEGGFLLASNHLANVDSFVIPVVAHRPIRFISKDTFWTNPGIKGWIQKTFMNMIGTVPVDRDTLASGQGALEVAARVIREGDGFGIYPEGTRSKDGLLHKGHQGVAWLALETGCPVIPLGLRGTPDLFPKGKLPPLFRRVVSLDFGKPIDFSDIPADQPAGRRRRAMTERVMQEIQALSGQERTDTPSTAGQ